jgi:hypothetical protein
MRDLALKVLNGNQDNGIEVVDSAPFPTCVPYACELVGVAIRLTLATTIRHSWDCLINDVRVVANTVVVPSGFTQGVTSPSAKIFLEAGDRIALRSNGETVTASTNATYQFIFKPLSPRPVGEVWFWGDHMSDIAAVTASNAACAPVASKVVGYAASLDAAVDADVTIDLQVDGVSSGSTVTVPNLSTGGLFTPQPALAVKAGAQLLASSGGQGTTGGSNRACWVLQPDGPSHPAGWIFLPFNSRINLGSAETFVAAVCPVNGRVRNLVIHATSPVDTETNLALLINGLAPTGAPNYVLTVDTLDESGQSMPIANAHDIYIAEGDQIAVISGAEMLTAANSSGGVWIEPLEGIQ